MIKDSVLSSEQALDEYFTSLLDEEGLMSSVEAEAREAQNAAVAEKTPVSEEMVAEVPTEISTDSVPSEQADSAIDSSDAETEELAVDTASAEDLSDQGQETQEQELDEAQPEQEEEPNLADYGLELQPEVQPEPIPSYTETVYNEFEAPDLEDVQRLLSQLESTNIADEPEIEELIVQNTAEIATLSPEEDVVEEVAVEEPAVEVVSDEIQSWDVTEPVVEDIPEVQEVQTQEEVVQEEVSEPEVEVQEPESTVDTEVDAAPETQSGGDAEDTWHTVARNEAFQALYFDVNGVTFAVPLDELGGIHRKNEELNHLIGRPDWYLGLQTNRSDQLDVVDTARWVMSEKLTDNSHRENYEYIVMLGESHWGLAANKLLGTEWLDPEKVRWRESAGKRPWLAGMVKEKMCALIHVEELVSMLNAGLDVKALDS
ncbi:CheW domain-containing protein [Vibrio nigripulchritudo ATCC 27043]|uniref:chemotaxis protein CheW n=1 Tax=Vibrio nigripulchritudo TaxID=28173 RepID=UPI00021C18E3|nr:chemotaxis protein CheW [Vibrio nigripulchritudo]EGU54317.1 CheW domain-containing protein [Vibrio nigripulchritudo ATCC 27043]